MVAVSVSRHRNQLLAALSPPDFALLHRHLEPLTLKLRYDMEKPNKSIDDVYFMDMGIASVVAVQTDGTRVEVGLIGREGMSGTAVVLGNHSSPHETYIQVAGEGQRIASAELRKAMKASASLHGLLLKYVQAFMVQTAHTAIANARAKLDERLSPPPQAALRFPGVLARALCEGALAHLTETALKHMRSTDRGRNTQFSLGTGARRCPSASGPGRGRRGVRGRGTDWSALHPKGAMILN
jgi:hypothetical protein